MAHIGHVTSRAWGLLGALQCLECHTLHNTSKLQPVIRRPVRGSSFPGTGCWVLPELHFPAGAAAHALLRTRTLPWAEWGLCVASGSGNTTGSIPWHGTCLASLPKHDTHSSSPSVCCFCRRLLPFTYQPVTSAPPATPRGLPHPPHTKVTSKGGTAQEGFNCPFHLLKPRMTSFLPA